MSTKWMSYFLDNSTLEGSELLLALAIADHANNDGIAWPGVSRLAGKIRLGERRTKSLIAILKDKGYLTVVPQIGRGHLATFQLQKVKRATPFIHEERVQSESEKGAIWEQEKVKSGVCNIEEPLREPKTNPGDDSKFVSIQTLRTLSATGSSISPDFHAYRDAVEDWYSKTHNVPGFPPNKTSADHISWLFNGGFTLSDIQDFYAFAKKEPWRKGSVNLGAIVNGIAEWRSSRKQAAQSEPSVAERMADAEEFGRYLIPLSEPEITQS